MVERAPFGGGAFLLRQVLVCAFAGIEADQVVELVAVGPGGLEETSVPQAFQGGFGAVVGPVGQGGGGGGGVGGQAEQAQQGQQVGGVAAGGFFSEAVVADRDAGANGQVGVLQHVQASGGVGQPYFQVGQGPVGAGRQAGADDPQGEGETAAQVDDPLGRLRFGAYPVGSGQAGQ